MEAIALDRTVRVVHGPDTNPGRVEAQLLVVSGDSDIGIFRKALSEEPWQLEQARSSAAAAELASVKRFDVMLLDAALYRQGEWSWLQSAEIPTILVSHPASHHEFGTLLAAKPADFLFRPFHAPELLVRIKKVLGRIPARSNLYQSDTFSVDLEQRQCRVRGRSIHLTAHEAGFLSALLNSPRRFCTYQQLIEQIWGRSRAVETQNLRVLAVQLRKKIEAKPDDPALVITVTGVGYRLQLP